MAAEKHATHSEHHPVEHKIVPMGAWAEGREDTILETRNLGPCIGLALYEPQTKQGFLLHDPLPQDLNSPYNQLEDHLRVVFKDQPASFERLQAWLSGGSGTLASTFAEGADTFVAENRQFMVDALSSIGITPESVRVNWIPEGHVKTDMSLDCSNGTCKITFL